MQCSTTPVQGSTGSSHGASCGQPLPSTYGSCTAAQREVCQSGATLRATQGVVLHCSRAQDEPMNPTSSVQPCTADRIHHRTRLHHHPQASPSPRHQDLTRCAGLKHQQQLLLWGLRQQLPPSTDPHQAPTVCDATTILEVCFGCIPVGTLQVCIC
jgi:hypothetical protein